MRKIALATANRAERGLLEPIIRRLKERKDVDFQLWEAPFFDQENLFAPYEIGGKGHDYRVPTPDVVLVPADRKEMVELAMYLYYEGIPIFHLWAGVGATGTWDDLNRRIISSCAYLMLCEDAAAQLRLLKSQEESWRVIITGTTHFDDLEIDEGLVATGRPPCTLVLVNPNDPFENYTLLVDEADSKARSSGWPVVWVSDNEGRLPHRGFGLTFSDVPRPRFLGLLKNCKQFVTNSSSAVYEAKYFGVDVVHVGKRNAERTTDAEMKPGAADRIVELLATYPIEPAKMLKVYP